MKFQTTLNREIRCFSVGLHSGRKVGMTIRPSGVDGGIVFVRKDLPQSDRISASVHNVTDTTLATTLGTNGTRVLTVEHLMSAFHGMGVDNALVEVDTFEVPIMDGSALPFVNLIAESGLKSQNKARKYLVIRKPVSVSDGESTAMFKPSARFEITYRIDFEHPAVGGQSYHVALSNGNYEREICAARTFGFLRDVEYLQAKGLALGGSLNNAVVLDDEKVINKEGLRCPDEFVKHKILDAIGDLYLIGVPIIGHFVAYKSGHKLNIQLLRELLAKVDCWEMLNHEDLRKGLTESKPAAVSTR
ncbi:MAG TPA: UDP-3-O-acyl-N-acetylglucosamine deacetylase [Syntrophales bacterium]|nr:UDP-3-O-acyl-N-acetylglucosamine deacetylase [Syntrophales bacterium]HOX95395.1 UDP-3-O-acyl-N-acetylglucosamine deacetylase [Syntrophales bacterium]HPI56442.1 UDP-3-O-acyl-N-acetylglucosamine deacetylase [Syntrophales bacterium]HPN24170.1 UDP-3-O-acyl-N-acetylglucosamine deacetylase [Syntrophales bacterium]HQM28523.1 UDP-3-O-acyl-N-acetylglucosamine deacetylase [Syntrophales bacterium]